MATCAHAFVTAEVTDAPENHEDTLGTILTICAICGHIADAEQ